MAYIDDLYAELARLRKLPSTNQQAIIRVQQQIDIELKRQAVPVKAALELDNAVGSKDALPALSDTGEYSLLAYQKRMQQKLTTLNDVDFATSAYQVSGNSTLASIYGATSSIDYFSAGIYGRIQSIDNTLLALDRQANTVLSNAIQTLPVRPSDYRYEVALGLRSAARTVNKFGYNGDLDIGTETIWTCGGSFTKMSAADTLNIVSTSVNDDASPATGAWSIILTGIDENYEYQTETIGLDGTTPVTTVNQWFGINKAEVYETGSGGVNAGDINITVTTGGAVQGQIPAGAGLAQQAIFFTQANHTTLLDWVFINDNRIAGGGSPVVTLKAWIISQVTGSKYEVFRYVMDTAIENNVSVTPSQPFVIAEKSVLYFDATTDTNNTICSVRFSLIEFSTA